MWSHYANGHNSISIGVEVDESKYLVKSVKYDGVLSLQGQDIRDPVNTALKVLSHKLEIWDYEQEYRAFVRELLYIEVQIKEVIFGSRVSSVEREFHENLFSKLYDEKIEFRSKR